MKYAVFFVALLGTAPLAFILQLDRKWMKFAVWGAVAALALWQSTAINFFSFEDYRGSSRGMEVSVAYLLAAAILGACALRGRFAGLAPSPGAKLFLLYFLLCLPSWSSAENTLYCWLETWKMIMVYLFYLAIRSWLDAADGAKALVDAFAWFTIWNFFLIVKAHVSGVYQPHGSFPHQNSMVMAMHMYGCMFLSSYLCRGRRGNMLHAAAFVCAAACAVRSYSRGAIALMPLAYGVVFLLAGLKAAPVRFGRVFSRAVPLGVAGLLGLAVMLPRIIDRFENAPESSGGTRVELARCAVEMMRDEPWRGVGMNNWGIKINPPYGYAELAGRSQNRGDDFQDGIVETVYLLVGAECGIPALVAMCLWFFWYLFSCVRLVWRLAGTEYCWIPAGLAGGMLACYMQSTLEWVLRQQMNLVVMMSFFALVDWLDANSRSLRKSAAEAAGAKNGSVAAHA